LIQAARDPQLSDAADEASEDVLPGLVGAAWKKLSKRARKLDPDDPEEAFHKVRIRAKRVRYASEAVAPSLGHEGEKKAAAFAKYAEKVQDALGANQDAVVARDVVSEIARHSDHTPFALAAGQLIERQSAGSADYRATFFDVWRDFDRKKNRSWLA
jgi:CHAD domain-containing protein